jgi:Flp pilus assembly protein TadG
MGNMKKKKGQAVLEIALVLPILLLVFCGITDFGRILYSSTHLNMITQESVRLAGLGKSDYQVGQYVSNNTYLVNKDLISVTITPADTARKSGDYVTVKIDYGINYITPLVGSFLPSPFGISTQSTMRVE